MLLNCIQALKNPVDEGTGQTDYENRKGKISKTPRLSCSKSSDAYRISQSYFSLQYISCEACQ